MPKAALQLFETCTLELLTDLCQRTRGTVLFHTLQGCETNMLVRDLLTQKNFKINSGTGTGNQCKEFTAVVMDSLLQVLEHSRTDVLWVNCFRYTRQENITAAQLAWCKSMHQLLSVTHNNCVSVLTPWIDLVFNFCHQTGLEKKNLLITNPNYTTLIKVKKKSWHWLYGLT